MELLPISQILSAIGLGGLIAVLIATGQLRTNREVKEHIASYEAQLAAKDAIIAYERKEKAYYRQGMERLLLGVEKLADTVGDDNGSK